MLNVHVFSLNEIYSWYVVLVSVAYTDGPKSAGKGENSSLEASQAVDILGASHRPGSARKDRIGSPRRPMSAKLAFRRQERGVKLRTDIYVAPNSMWADRLGINRRALLMFPEAPRVVVENPREQLVEVLFSIVEVLEKHRSISEYSDGVAREGSTVRPKSPPGLLQFKRPRPSPYLKPGESQTVQAIGWAIDYDGPSHFIRSSGDEDSDLTAIEKKILDQSRKLDVHLQDVWNGSVALSQDETHAIQFLIKERIIPTMDSRIARLHEIIRDIMPESLSDYKETPMQPARDLSSYEQELEKRIAARETMIRDLRNITTKKIELKHKKKVQDLLSSTTLQNSFSKVNPKKAAHETHERVDSVEFDALPSSRREALTKGQCDLVGRADAKDSKSGDQPQHTYIPRIVELMGSSHIHDQISGLEQFCHLNVEEVLKRAHVQHKEHFRSKLVDCLLSPNMLLRKTALPLLSRNRVLFSKVPVQAMPPLPDPREVDPEVHEGYVHISDDNALLKSIFERAEGSSYEAQDSLLNEICKVVRIQDDDNMKRLFRFLKSPQSFVRISAVKALTKHTACKNSLETLHAIAALKNDPEWDVRVAVCSALPNIAGMVQILAKVEKVKPFHFKPKVALPCEYMEDEILNEEVAVAEARKKEVRSMWKLGMHLAARYARRENEMRAITMKVLEEFLDDEADNTRRAAILMFSKVATPGTRRSASLLLKGCCDHSPTVRAAAFRCLPSIVHRKIDPALETFAYKIDQKTTVDWLVEELVAMMDPEKVLHSNPRIGTKLMSIHPRTKREQEIRDFKQEIRRHALTSLVGDESETLVNPVSEGNTAPIPGIVPKAHLRVLQGFNEHIYKGDIELQKAILEMLPDITTPTSENHTLAVLPALHCLTSPNDSVRQTAALVLPKLVAGMGKDSVAVGHLVTLLGAGRENDSKLAPATKRSVMAVLQSISGLQTDDLKAQRGLLMDIAFGLNSSFHEYHKLDEESIMEPMMEIESKTLDSYPDSIYVAKGLCCRLSTGVSGFDASHWKRRLILLKKDGSLLLTFVRSKEEPTCVFHEFSNFTVSRISYGSIVQHAGKFEITQENTSGVQYKETVVIGFFTKDEANIWMRDFKNIIHRNTKRAALELEAQRMKKKGEIVKLTEPDYVGRTEKLLGQYVDSLLNPVIENNSDFEAKQRFIQEKLNQLFNDKKAFVNAESYNKAFAKASSLRRQSNIPPELNQAAGRRSIFSDAKHAPAKADENPEDNTHLSVKLDMIMFLGLLRANDVYGNTGFTQQAVSQAWKTANAGGGNNFKEVHQSKDKDSLKLDWFEYQTCIRLLAKKAGVSLDVDIEQHASAKVNSAAREAAGALLSKHWSDIHLFIRHSAGSTLGPSKTSAHVIGDSHLKTMDYKEFLGLAQYLKVYPNLLARYQLSEIFKEANSEDHGEDEGGHELNFDEFKSAMIGMASELDLPIMCNGRNLASTIKFPLKREAAVAFTC